MTDLTSTTNRADFEIFLGSDWSYEVVWQTGDPATAVNLTGYTARMDIRMESYDRPVELQLTDANSRIVFTDRLNGTFTLNMTAAETEALNGGRAGTAIYDLELVSTTGVVKRLLQGEMTLVRNVTR